MDNIINPIAQGIHAVTNFFAPQQTNTLPKQIMSPIPQGQMASYQPQSAYEQALGAVGRGIQIAGNDVQAVKNAFVPTPTTPTPTPYDPFAAHDNIFQYNKYPGETQYITDQYNTHPKSPSTYKDYASAYEQAVSSPGWSGKYYGGATGPTNVGIQQAQPQAQPQQPPIQVTNAPLASGIDRALQYVSSFVPQGADPKQYYPALADPQFMQGILEADRMKPGLGNVLLMQAFHESTLGRAQNGNNAFGALPGGEGSGKTAAFKNLAESLQYQLGPNMLHGGANKNMDILDEPGPLTQKRLAQLYQSYNPEGSYINQLLTTLK